MNTRVEVVAPPGRAREAGEVAAAVFSQYERTLSRFSPDSPLSELNRAGRLRFPPRLLVSALRRAIFWHRLFPDLFDPTMLPSLERAGYDRSFERIGEPRGGRSPSRLDDDPCTMSSGDRSRAAWTLRVGNDHISLPPGVRADLGGIGKGLAVDAALEALRAAGIDRAVVNAGGDLRVLGSPPGSDAWTVAVPGPFARDAEAGPIRVARLRNRALATSSTLGRRWLQSGAERHHLIDPRTGQPSLSPWVWVTAVAPDAETADVLAKVVLLAGPEGAESVLSAVGGAHALWVDRFGASGEVVKGRDHAS